MDLQVYYNDFFRDLSIDYCLSLEMFIDHCKLLLIIMDHY